MKDEFLSELRSRGYWRTSFQPLVIQELRHNRCRELVEKNGVALRGWTFPHFPRRDDDGGGLESHAAYIQGWTDWARYKELWRMYRSGQFIHLMGLREDWCDRPGVLGGRADIEPMALLGIIGSVVYQVTEFFEFLARLAKSGLYEEGVRVSVSLHNTKGRELWIEDALRGPFHVVYRTQANEVPFERVLSNAEAIGRSVEIAREVIIGVFESFGWAPPNEEQIEKDQDALLKGLI